MKKGAAFPASSAGTAKSPARGEEDFVDALDEARRISNLLRDPRHEKPLDFLRALMLSPPQTLILEGGSARERSLAALYAATLLNCPEEGNAPCLGCSVCLRIAGRMHRDIFYLDGQEASIKIDAVRGLRSVLGEAPREAKKRVIIIAEAQALTEAAANAMLKSLEEPCPGTAFILLTPQRERLLPTLVSRSWALTLAWPGSCCEENQDAVVWDSLIASFIQSGSGLFERTGARGSMDAAAAQAALFSCQRALVSALSGGQATPLASFFASLPEERQRMTDEILAEVQESLGYMVNPALALEWMATRFFLLRGNKK